MLNRLSAVKSHLNVFFFTDIEDPKEKLGALSKIGNALFSPLRFLNPSAKTIWVEIEKDVSDAFETIETAGGRVTNTRTVYRQKAGSTFAKVSSYFSIDPIDEMEPVRIEPIDPDYDKASKQNRHLMSTERSKSRVKLLLILAPVSLPLCIVLGTIIKSLSYFSPRVRAAHRETKRKLTPLETYQIPGSIKTTTELNEKLTAYLKTGQKTRDLLIYGAGDEAVIDNLSLSHIAEINAEKTIFAGPWQLRANLKNETSLKGHFFSIRHRKKWEGWDYTRLMPAEAKDSSQALPLISQISVQQAQDLPRPRFFKNPLKKEANPVKKHTIYLAESKPKV